ncbi:hypothetical protein ACHHYP_10911 [Achlya hypogyna]|uniref:Uncharacterized protein n=1 Tax=Achlya hypogyna TaxID=1202772 RepID=A0A1V9YKA0_ACHHY|nr:hypothetical protein ACHHYP_10911 [Achlya hypogyna]
MAELGEKLAVSFCKITSNTWMKALRKVQGFEDMYVAIADTEDLAEDDRSRTPETSMKWRG